MNKFFVVTLLLLSSNLTFAESKANSPKIQLEGKTDKQKFIELYDKGFDNPEVRESHPGGGKIAFEYQNWACSLDGDIVGNKDADQKLSRQKIKEKTLARLKGYDSKSFNCITIKAVAKTKKSDSGSRDDKSAVANKNPITNPMHRHQAQPQMPPAAK